MPVGGDFESGRAKWQLGHETLGQNVPTKNELCSFSILFCFCIGFGIFFWNFFCRKNAGNFQRVCEFGGDVDGSTPSRLHLHQVADWGRDSCPALRWEGRPARNRRGGGAKDSAGGGPVAVGALL